jgi:hypothetical protein
VIQAQVIQAHSSPVASVVASVIELAVGTGCCLAVTINYLQGALRIPQIVEKKLIDLPRDRKILNPA